MAALLKNNEINRSIKVDKDGMIATAFIAYAAIEGPFKREFDFDGFLSYALGVVICIACVVVFLDITVWRP